MASSEWYEDWFNSPFYHKLYFERDETEAGLFLQRLVAHLQPPPGSRMLDVACGKGRHSKQLAGTGFVVTGIDISADSIAKAKEAETDGLHFFVHDMRLPFWINYFDYAFNFFTSFGYFRTRREHDAAIRTIGGSLKKEGIVLIDYLNTHYAESHLVQTDNKTIGETNYAILRWHDAHHFYKRITVTDPTLSQPMSYTEKVAKFSLGDFNDMLSYQRLQVTEVFGNYELQAYDVHKTPRLIVVAKKF